jgi:thioredoxin reductase
MYDVIIVGGGTAGLSAALVLGRARRRTLVCDSGRPRNTPSRAVHGFYSRDGVEPTRLRGVGLEQLRQYDTVDIREVEAVKAERHPASFEISLADGSREQARALILATGVVDLLPEVPGFRELWGTGVYHCPYCHGWELRDQPLAVYGWDQETVDFTRTLLAWSRNLRLCTGGSGDISPDDRARLGRWSVPIREAPIETVEHMLGDGVCVIFASGERLLTGGVFLHPGQRQHSDLASLLGCSIDEAGIVETDTNGYTGIPGLYAAGDLRQSAQQVATAASDGTLAAISLVSELLEHDYP